MEVHNIRQQIIAEETYAKERIAEGGLQTVGGVISVVAGVGLIIATAGMATPIVAGAFVVGSCSTFYGLSNTTEGTQNLYYGFSGDGTSVAVNSIRDSIFKSNPELYYKIGNASTIISTMGTPIASGVPVERVMATQTKRLASSAVGSVASNALMDRYDMNPYVAMGIGMGISGITYRGIESMKVDTTLDITASDVKGVKEVLVDENRKIDSKDNVKRVKGIEVDFKYKTKYNEDEFSRQLANQEKYMNQLTVDEYLKNRERYMIEGRTTESIKIQKVAREKALMDKIRELRDSGLSAREADIQAQSWLNTQAALHNPDLIAGGNLLQVDDVGDKGINSSIGAQWKYRISTVDRHVQSLANNMTEIERKSTYLNVKLKY